VRFRDNSLRHSRWHAIGAFLRHPSTGRALSLRRIQAVTGMGMFHEKPREPVSPKELGVFLKRTRMARGHSIYSIHLHTGIQKEYLEAIERGDFAVLPLGLYRRTFVDIYARELSIPSAALQPFYEAISEAVELPQPPDNSVAVKTEIKPPRLGEYLLYLFLTKRERVSLIGDIEEEYVDVYERFGRRSAKIWYYKQVFDSLRPLIRRALAKTGVVLWLWKHTGWIYEHVLQFINNLKLK
jgi:hypothetical protein